MQIQNRNIFYKTQPPAFKASGVKNLSSWAGNFEQWQAGDNDKFIRTDYKPLYTELDILYKNLIFSDSPASKHAILNDFLKLPGYLPEHLMPVYKRKTGDLKYLQRLAGQSDMLGQVRIPSDTLNLYARVPVEKLEKIESILLSKNDMGLWNYEPESVKVLLKLDEQQLWTFKKLVEYHVEANNILSIIRNKTLNWEKTVEKAESLNRLYGEDLREISFYSNTKGENYLSADIQLPHRDDKPDWQNYKRVYSKLDDDVNPVASQNSKAQIDSYVENIYEKIKKQLYVFDEKSIKQAINKIKLSVPDASEQEILSVMQRLTQFANYSSLNSISKQLKNNNISSIIDEGKPNIYFKYFNHNKNILPLELNDDGKFAYFVTKESLDSLEEIEKIKKYANDNNVIFINLDGWSNGINIFSDDNKLEQVTETTLIKVKKLNEINPDLTFDEAISEVLNKDIINTMKKLGADVKTIRIKNPATETQILDQMKPEMPTKGLIKSTIESIAQHYTTKDKTFADLSERIAKYYDENINSYSKQSIIENLKLMDKKINEYLEKNSISKENLYFVMPETYGTHKSYEVITKMYSDLFDIPDEKILSISDITDVEMYPENSAFVVLDDVVASGESMLSVGEYMFNAADLPVSQHIIFAPITASNTGLQNIKNLIKDAERENLDDIIYINSKEYKDTKKIFSSSEKMENKYANEAFGKEGHGKAGMCTVFPYMDPDNNSSLAGYFTKFFVPSSHCLKSKTDLIPVIEEKTYYYDIFGTNKECVEAGDKKKSNNIFLKNLLRYLKKS